uniref:Ig-like domain-containing protein n=1 Tax=Sus scrofa TaxID=9823 RepID=A0A8W4FKR9_PIG
MERNPLSASLLILWLHLDQFLCVTLVEPGPPSLQAQEGESTNFTCNFPSSSFCVLHWYRGGPAQSPKNLFVMTLNGGTKQNGRLNATTVTTERRSSLHISSAQITDSATYLCAGEHSAPQAPAACTETLRGAQPLLQPKSHPGATTGHSHFSLFLTYTGTLLTTSTFWPYRFGTLVFYFLPNLYLLLL